MRYPCAMLFAAALLAGCNVPAMQPGDDSLVTVYRTLADDAMEGRATGSAGYARAADYVAREMQHAGLRLQLQPVEYASGQLDIAATSMTLYGPDGAVALAWGEDFVTSADTLRPVTALRAPATFVGYGIQAPEMGHDDYAGIDVSGRIVVLMAGAPQYFGANERAHFSGRHKTDAAVAAGAVGIVWLRNAYDIEHYEWSTRARNAGVQPALDYLDLDGQPGRHHPEILGSATLSEDGAEKVFDGAALSYAQLLEADGTGEPMARFKLAAEIEIVRHQALDRLQAPNVIGVIPGADPALAEEFVVLSAHLDGLGIGTPVAGDAIYNGAYDNAIGVSIMLEIGRQLIAAEVPPRRSIALVAVGGEENGLLGSEFFARHPPLEGRIVANVNIDMVLFLFPIAELVAYGAEHTTLGAAAAVAAAREGLVLVPDPYPEEVIFVRSDHYSFVREGVPALMLDVGSRSADPSIDGDALIRDFLREHYHQPSDDLGQPVHWPSVRSFARFGVGLVADIAAADEPPAWLPDSFFGQRHGPGATQGKRP